MTYIDFDPNSEEFKLIRLNTTLETYMMYPNSWQAKLAYEAAKADYEYSKLTKWQRFKLLLRNKIR